MVAPVEERFKMPEGDPVAVAARRTEIFVALTVLPDLDKVREEEKVEPSIEYS